MKRGRGDMSGRFAFVPVHADESFEGAARAPRVRIADERDEKVVGAERIEIGFAIRGRERLANRRVWIGCESRGHRGCEAAGACEPACGDRAGAMVRVVESGLYA